MCPLLPSASGHPHLLEMDFAPHVDLVSVVGLKVAFVTWQITTTVFTGYRLSANDTNLACVSPSSNTGCIVKQGVRFHMLCSGVTTQYFFSMICSLPVNEYQVSMVPKAILDILFVIFSVTWLLLTEIDLCLAVLGFPPKI